MCQCMIAKLVVSRFPKDRDIRKQWVFQWRIQSWSQGGFPNVANVSRW